MPTLSLMASAECGIVQNKVLSFAAFALACSLRAVIHSRHAFCIPIKPRSDSTEIRYIRSYWKLKNFETNSSARKVVIPAVLTRVVLPMASIDSCSILCLPSNHVSSHGTQRTRAAVKVYVSYGYRPGIACLGSQQIDRELSFGFREGITGKR